MTALTASRGSRSLAVGTTSFDRMLLRAASALDGLVAARLERRAVRAASAASAAAQEHDERRAAAQALGAFGIMPR